MKKILITLLAVCMLLTTAIACAEPAASVLTPLPDSTMEELDNSTVAIAMTEGGIYLDDTGALRIYFQVYTYDKYDLVDVSMLKAGDVIVMCGEEIDVTSVETSETGTVLINGGLEEGGVDLITYDDGVYFAHGYNDAKSWYLVGEADYPVSTEFLYTDSSDLEKEEPVVIYPGDFLLDEVEIDYFFVPENTTLRIENGVVVAMDRVYIP